MIQFLKKSGDDLRIDWGYMYVAVPKTSNALQAISASSEAIANFAAGKPATASNKITGKHLLLNTVLPFGNVGNTPKQQMLMLAYDDLYSIQYFKQNLRPWWNRDSSKTIITELEAASAVYTKVIAQCETFNKQMHADAVNAGGET